MPDHLSQTSKIFKSHDVALICNPERCPANATLLALSKTELNDQRIFTGYVSVAYRWLFGSPTSWGKSGPLVSRNLTMVSQCSLSSVPTYLLTDTRFQLKLTHPTDVSLLNSMFNDTTGIVAKLSYSTNTGKMSQLVLEASTS